MEFRPCIDIHNGKVKQIIGGTLRDTGDQALENFVSEQDAAFYAAFYRSYDLRNGHIILLNPVSSPYYDATCHQALLALDAWPGALQIGGGITDQNAEAFIRAGASHVIVTSHVFSNGFISYERLSALTGKIGKQRLVLDLSCRKKGDVYYIVTDRWQTFTETPVTEQTLLSLSAYCDEFLVHAADVEGKAAGIDASLVEILSSMDGFPITYAGGVGSFDDLEQLRISGKNRIHVTVGSALDLFGGHMEFESVLKFCRQT